MNKRIQQAEVLLQQKKVNPNKILKLLRPLIKKKNTPWKAYHFSGIAHFLSKEFAKAERFFERAQENNGQSVEIKYFLGRCNQIAGDHEKAIEYLKEAVEINQDDYKAWMLLGDLQKEEGDLNEALKCYGECNRIDPSKSEVAMKTGEIYRDQAFSDKALEMFDIVLKMEPENITALNEKAKLLQGLQDFENAEEVIGQALDIAPKNAGLLMTKAEIVRNTGDFQKALSIYDQILASNPHMAAARSNYANILQDLGRLNEAEKNFLQASEDDPSIQICFSNYLFVQHYNPEKTKEEIFKAHTKWDPIFAPENPKRPFPENRDADKPLRVGLISGGFRKHPVGWMIVAGMEHLQKEKIELVYYSNHSKVDEVSKRLYETASEWRVITGFSDEKVDQMIRDDEIDILIELSGHAAESRLRTVAMEPAPVIVKWVGGLFNTTGLKAMDYLITDRIETPAGTEADYVEKLVRMPDDYICFSPSPDSPDVCESPFKENGYITFGCFNNPVKVNPVLLEKWAEILKKVPDSRLFLKSKQYGNVSYTSRIKEQLKSLGIEKERLIFEGQSPHVELLEAYNRVDIALDPWPYSGGLTTCEALWMGVPVITCPGPTFAGRHAATHVHHAGFPEWIADSWEEYTEKVVEMATDREKLQELRSGLRETVAASPLCDGKRFGTALGAALRKMWRQRAEGYANNAEGDDWGNHIDLASLPENYFLTSNGSPDAERDAVQDVGNNELLKEISSENGAQTALTKDKPFKDIQKTAMVDSQYISKPGGDHADTAALYVLDEPNSSKQAENADLQSQKGSHQNLFITTRDNLKISVPESTEILTTYVLLEQQDWYEHETEFVRDYLQPGMSVVDVGAGFGIYALPAAKLVGEMGAVYAFEPTAEAIKHVEISKLENNFQNLRIIDKAVSDRSGRQAWSIAETPELNRLDANGKEETQTITLDSWWQFEGEPAVDFLKVDVNGAEGDVLKGAPELLKREAPLLMISITDQKADTFVKELKKIGYNLYEYIPGPGVLADYELNAGADPYLQNLVAIPESRLVEFREADWTYDETIKPIKVDQDFWKRELSKLPWTEELMETWEKHDSSESILSYLQALNYLIAAEQIDGKETDQVQPRSQKAVLFLNAAQILIQLYNQGAQSVPVAFTLIRTLNALGKRGQAVEIMQALLETTKMGQENMNVDLPFMLPFPEQDHASIKTDLDKWLIVKTVEAWILLKDLTTYWSGEKEQKLLEVLEGNPEVCISLMRVSRFTEFLNGGNNKYYSNSDPLEVTDNKKISFTSERNHYFNSMVELICKNGPEKSTSHDFPGELIVSLTSYPARFEKLPLTLLSIINQTVKPDRIILWIAEQDKNALDADILQFRDHGVEIRFCEDLKSYKKIIPTLLNYPEAFIITADDDLYYSKRWIQGLVQDYNSNDCVIAHRVHRVLFDESGNIKPYKDWGWQYRGSFEPSELNFPTSGAGTLYPPGIFHKDVTNKELFQKLAPKADDIWLYWMVRMNDGTFKVCSDNHPLKEWKQNSDETLWNENLLKGKNDEQLKNVLSYYGRSLNAQIPVTNNNTSAVKKAVELSRALNDRNKINELRRKSIAQSLRRNFVKFLLNNEKINKKQVNGFVDQFNALTGTVHKGWKEILIYKLEFEGTPGKLELSSKNKNDLCKPALTLLKETKGLSYQGFYPILQGSLADGRYTHYSDVDISLFIEAEQLMEESKRILAIKEIQMINKAILKVDSIGHHGAFINLYEDFKSYPEANMPLSVLSGGFLLSLEELKAEVQTRDSTDLAFQTLVELSMFFINLPNQQIRTDALNLKNIISRFFIINLLHYELSFEDFEDKRTILTEGIKNIASPVQEDTLDILSRIRAEWPDQNYNTTGFLSSAIIKKCAEAADYILSDLVTKGVFYKIQKNWLK